MVVKKAKYDGNTFTKLRKSNIQPTETFNRFQCLMDIDVQDSSNTYFSQFSVEVSFVKELNEK